MVSEQSQDLLRRYTWRLIASTTLGAVDFALEGKLASGMDLVVVLAVSLHGSRNEMADRCGEALKADRRTNGS